MTNKYRCYDHKESVTLPPLCHTCQRIAVESKIVRKTVKALLAAGYALHVDGQGDDDRPEMPTRDEGTILREMMETDDDFLIVSEVEHSVATNYEPLGWVRFVYGNDGYDVISDYTTNLEDVLKPVNDYADTFA